MKRDLCFVHIPKTGGSSFWKMLAQAGDENHRVANTYRVSLQEFGSAVADLRALALILEQPERERDAAKPFLIHHHTLSCPGNLRDFQYLFSTRDPVSRCFSEYRHHCLIASGEIETQPGNWFDAIGAAHEPRRQSAPAYFRSYGQGLNIYRRTIYSLFTGIDHADRKLPGLWASLTDRNLRSFLRRKIAVVIDLKDFANGERLKQTAKLLGIKDLKNTHVEATRTRRGCMAKERERIGDRLVLWGLTLADRIFLAYVRWCAQPRTENHHAEHEQAPEKSNAAVSPAPCEAAIRG